MLPILVDIDMDAMCFLSVNQSLTLENYDDISFSTYFQETLKIHNSLNGFLFDRDLENYQVDEFLLSLRYRSEFFGEAVGDDNDMRDSQAHFAAL